MLSSPYRHSSFNEIEKNRSYLPVIQDHIPKFLKVENDNLLIVNDEYEWFFFKYYKNI
jgi:hypothetical protein